MCTFVACILIANIILITFGGDGMLTNLNWIVRNLLWHVRDSKLVGSEVTITNCCFRWSGSLDGVVAMDRGLQKHNQVQAQKPHIASYSLKPTSKSKPKALQKPIQIENLLYKNVLLEVNGLKNWCKLLSGVLNQDKYPLEMHPSSSLFMPCLLWIGCHGKHGLKDMHGHDPYLTEVEEREFKPGVLKCKRWHFQ